MINFLTELGKCLLFIIAIPFLILLSIPLGIYAFVNYVIGMIQTLQGKKPSIVTEFDQKPSDLPRDLKIQPNVLGNPYSEFMKQPSISNNSTTTNSNNVTNSNNTMNNSNNTTNYIFNNVPDPFNKDQSNDQVKKEEKKDEKEPITTFVPADDEKENKVIDTEVKEVPLTDYRSLVGDTKKIEDKKFNSLPSPKEDRK